MLIDIVATLAAGGTVEDEGSEARWADFVAARSAVPAPDATAQWMRDLDRCLAAAPRARGPARALQALVESAPAWVSAIARRDGPARGAVAESLSHPVWQPLVSAWGTADEAAAAWVAGTLSQRGVERARRSVSELAPSLRTALEARVWRVVRWPDAIGVPDPPSLALPHAAPILWPPGEAPRWSDGSVEPGETLRVVDPVLGRWSQRWFEDPPAARDWLGVASKSLAGDPRAAVAAWLSLGGPAFVAAATAMSDGAERLLALRRWAAAADQVEQWDREIAASGARRFAASAPPTDLPAGGWWDPRPRHAAPASVDGGWLLTVAEDGGGRASRWHWGAASGVRPEVALAAASAWRVAATLIGVTPEIPSDVPVLDGDVDGPSLGLPLALAWVARRLGVGAPAATGDLGPRGEVRPVAGVRAKAMALAAAAPGALMIVPRGQRDDVPVWLQLRVVEVADLREACEVAGFDLDRAIVGPVDPRAWRERAEWLCGALASGEGAWAGLPDQALAWADAPVRLRDPADAERRVRLRVAASIACLQAGRIDAATSALSSVDTTEPLFARGDGPALARLVSVARLARCVLSEAWDEGEEIAGKLRALKAPAPGTLGERVWGFELGTLGRWALHSPGGDRDVALGDLERSLAWHVENAREEAARSGIYVAMAHRVGGDLASAHRALDNAEARLDDVSSPTYWQTTWTYLQAERARLWLIQGDRDLAVEAMRRVEAALPLAIGPAAGARPLLLRARAWAWRALGDEESAAEDVRTLRAMAAEDDRPAMARIAADAEGHAAAAREVF